MSHFDTLKLNLHYGGLMEIIGGRFSYNGGASKQGIVVDPDLMTWSCFDGYCEEFSIEGGLVERVWWKLHHESMDTLKCIGVVASDSELMRMCSQAMSTCREVDVFIEQEEKGKDGEEADVNLEQSAAVETESEKALSAESEKAPSAEENESEIGEGESEEAEENQSQEAEENQSQSEEAEENQSEAAADESDKDAGNESEIDSEKEEALREAKRKKDKKGKSKVLEDEEDIGARYDMEIEDAVASFVDEEVDFRRTILESSDSYEFKEAVLDYALANAKNIEQNRWDKTKIGYKCGEGGKCKWKLYCSYDEPHGKWVIKTKCGYHSCTPKGRCKMLKAPVIAKLFLHKLRQKPNFWPIKMQKYIKETWRLLRTRWKSSCRPIIGLDGTFFKGIVKGCLLTAVGHDPNNQIYPIAWAVVQAETGDNWLWFMKNLKADLGLEDGSGYVIISDRCRGRGI
ncbi:unnamed protein product [Microthlaspi erraticum]|uniref:Uncharacterized protein n=1 Tax=Microthlaspi erraticum TaxID=1685480 RepID=A0A6D2I981_9BRAS|nr:unnamed protein product [Microthlaspi erraticum]